MKSRTGSCTTQACSIEIQIMPVVKTVVRYMLGLGFKFSLNLHKMTVNDDRICVA